MHVRNEDPAATAVKKELLSRVWWGFFSLEQMLSTITGRPSVGLEKHISVPLPLPLSTEDLIEATLVARLANRSRPYTAREPLSSTTGFPLTRGILGFTELEVEPTNTGSYLKHTVKIGMITQKTLLELYSPNVVAKSWESVQGIIADLTGELEAWATSLPLGLRFFHAGADPTHQRERFILELYYHNTKILITRPCLRHIDRRIQNQTKASHDFNQRTAATCVSAAKSISSLLPNNIPHDRVQLYQGPWWSIVRPPVKLSPNDLPNKLFRFITSCKLLPFSCSRYRTRQFISLTTVKIWSPP
jgi:hypothetical protein